MQSQNYAHAGTMTLRNRMVMMMGEIMYPLVNHRVHKYQEDKHPEDMTVFCNHPVQKYG